MASRSNSPRPRNSAQHHHQRHEQQQQRHEHQENHQPQRRREGRIARFITQLRVALFSLFWPIINFTRLLLTGRSSSRDEYDGLSAAVTAKASQSFVAYLKTIHNNNGSIGSNGSNNNGNQQNNSTHQTWLTTGFAAAQEQAAQQQSLLLVYLHSPLHRSSEAFCKNILCKDSMTAFINQPNVTAFGVSIHTAQGAYLASILQASCYPFIALLQPRLSTSAPSVSRSNSNNSNNSRSSSSGSSTMTLLLRAEGPALTELPAQQLITHFQTALQRHQTVVVEAEARRLQRQEEMELRQQQDAEYQAALLADQERERMKREEAEQEERRLKEIQEEEQRVEAEAKALLDNARSQVPSEPPAECSDPVTTIRFVLPSGAKLNRRFYSSETISGLIAFLVVHFHDNNIEISKNIGLSTNFPKKSYHGEPELTLKAAGLTPQAVLMVQDLDA